MQEILRHVRNIPLFLGLHPSRILEKFVSKNPMLTPSSSLRVGLVYDLLSDYEFQPHDPEDANAEYEPIETVEALETAFRQLGHETLRIGSVKQLLALLPTLTVDVVMNIAECAYGTRNREGYAPTLLEIAQIPYLGSDALTLSVSLDKVWTNRLLEGLGMPTPKHFVAENNPPYPLYQKGAPAPNKPLLPQILNYPLFVKPRYEGTAKGISLHAKVHNEKELQAQIAFIHQNYQQDALIEEFIEGSEYTVAVVGDAPCRALPVIQRATEKETGIGLHALEKNGLEFDYVLEGRLDANLENTLQRLAILAHEGLGCKDFSRSDFRVNAQGDIYFLEINPLPTFAPDGTFAIMAELEGKTYPDFLATILAEGLKRLGF